MNLRTAYKSVVLFGLVLGGLGACSKAEDPDTVAYDLPLGVVDPKVLPTDKMALYTALEAKQAVSFKRVSELLLQDQLSAFQTRTREADVAFPAALQSVQHLAHTSETSDPHQFKLDYEAEIERTNGHGLEYDIAYVTVPDPIRKTKLQCYSGTLLHTLLNRERSTRPQYRDRRWVVIFESGHVLPGYVDVINGVSHLIGIETTAAGKARKEYGPISELDGIQLRVVDTELFALVELFKFELKDGMATANAALNFTAQQIGLKNPFLIPTGAYVQAAYRAEQMNWSPFQFGTPDSTAGTRARVKFDLRDAATTRGALLAIAGVPVPIAPFARPPSPVVSREQYAQLQKEVIGRLPEPGKHVQYLKVHYKGAVLYFSPHFVRWMPLEMDVETNFGSYGLPPLEPAITQEIMLDP